MLRSTEPILDRSLIDDDRDRLQASRMRYYSLSTLVGAACWGQSVAFRVDNES
jgi:hypothetical protein